MSNEYKDIKTVKKIFFPVKLSSVCLLSVLVIPFLAYILNYPERSSAKGILPSKPVSKNSSFLPEYLSRYEANFSESFIFSKRIIKIREYLLQKFSLKAKVAGNDVKESIFDTPENIKKGAIYAERIHFNKNADLNLYRYPAEKYPAKQNSPEYENIYKKIINDFNKSEINKLFNSYLIERFNLDSCGHDFDCRNTKDYFCSFVKNGPGFVYTFESPEPTIFPPFRIRPDYPGNGKIVYSNFGFIGNDIDFAKKKNVIRLAFLGSSTTENTYPTFLTGFLQNWAKAANLDIKFEMLNAGRGGISSESMEKIFQYELKYFDPEMVFYYEGSNQFSRIQNIIVNEEKKESFQKDSQEDSLNTSSNGFTDILKKISLSVIGSNSEFGFEPEKPNYVKLNWNWSMKDPDLTDASLPMNLFRQIKSIRGIKIHTDEIKAELFLASFLMMVKDGMQLDRSRHKKIFETLNGELWPLTYRDIEYLIKFQNQVFKKTAQVNSIHYIPLAEKFPLDPDLFYDPVHMVDSGTKLQAWIMFQEILPLVQKKIGDKEWPKKTVSLKSHPFLESPPKKAILTRNCG